MPSKSTMKKPTNTSVALPRKGQTISKKTEHPGDELPAARTSASTKKSKAIHTDVTVIIGDESRHHTKQSMSDARGNPTDKHSTKRGKFDQLKARLRDLEEEMQAIRNEIEDCTDEDDGDSHTSLSDSSSDEFDVSCSCSSCNDRSTNSDSEADSDCTCSWCGRHHDTSMDSESNSDWCDCGECNDCIYAAL